MFLINVIFSICRRLKLLARRFFRRDEFRDRFMSEARRFFYLTIKYNASVATDEDMEKMQYTLLRENHVIEKGMSLRNTRKGYGQQKVINLIMRLSKYVDRYFHEDAAFLDYPLGTIAEYIRYTKSNGIDVDKIEKLFSDLCVKCGVSVPLKIGGVLSVFSSDIQKEAKGNFESLLRSRHSIRYYKDKVPERCLIERALELAQRTPSACNRQAWKTHVYMGKDSIDLIKWQGGSNGFEEEIKCSILVTANLKGFLMHEVHQAYIDGGLYAMNLINALHSLGLGTIPLSLGFEWEKLKELESFGVPENEVPILIVGCGEMLDNFHVAQSNRKPVQSTNIYHKLS